MIDGSGSDHIEVDHDGQPVCSAEVSLVDDDARLVRVSLHAESGHLPAGARRRLVDEVLELPQVRRSGHVAMAVPRGDSESLERLQERCGHLTARSAGATVIVDMDVASVEARSVAAPGPAPEDGARESLS